MSSSRSSSSSSIRGTSGLTRAYSTDSLAHASGGVGVHFGGGGSLTPVVPVRLLDEAGDTKGEERFHVPRRTPEYRPHLL